MKKVIIIFSVIVLLSCKDDKSNSTKVPAKSSEETKESISTDITQKAPLNKYEYEGLTLNYSKNIPFEKIKPTIIRTKRAIDYFNKHISNEQINVTVNVLSKEDWSDYTEIKTYGMPHTSGDASLIMAFEDNDFWKGTIPTEESISQKEMEKFKQVYLDSDNEINMKIFFDFLAIHELGHLIEMQSNVHFPKPWLQEFFANYFLHGYIATFEPENIEKLILSPNINVNLLSSAKFKTLQEFEDNYGDDMTALNYAWFQSRYHQIARVIFDEVGNEGIAKLFQKFKGEKKTITNKELIDMLKRDVSPKMADAFRSF